MLALTILLVCCLGFLILLGSYVLRNLEKSPGASLVVSFLLLPVLCLMAYLANALLVEYKADRACALLGGTIVNEKCLDIRQAPVLVLPGK